MDKTLREFFTKYPYADRTKFITDSVFGQSEPGVFFGPINDTYIYTGDAEFMSNRDYTKYLTINNSFLSELVFSILFWLTPDDFIHLWGTPRTGMSYKPPPRFPKIWLGGGTAQKIQGKRHWKRDIEGKYDFSKFTYLSDNAIDYDLNNFRICVNGQDFFMAKLPVLNPGNRTDIAVWWNNNELITSSSLLSISVHTAVALG